MIGKLGAALAGFLFALGLGISGMTRPEKVVGFLDLFGDWDPSLLLVMVGATAIHFVSFRLITRRNSPLFSSQWHLPDKTSITPSLVIGSLIFGLGWGLGGYCPGPAITSLASLESGPLLFVPGMILGMLIFRLLDKNLHLNR